MESKKKIVSMMTREGSLSTYLNSCQHFDRKNYLFRISYFNKKTESKLKKDDVILKGKIRSPSAASID